MDIRQKKSLNCYLTPPPTQSQLETIINNNSNNGRKKLWEVMGISMALMVEMVSWVYSRPQTHQGLDIEYVERSAYQKKSV